MTDNINTKKVTINDTTITIRKWKGRDKRNFLNALKSPEISEQELMNSLVYSCIEEDVVLSPDEFKYVMTCIRAFSLGDEVKYELFCDSCRNITEHTFNMTDLLAPVHSDVSENTIISGEYSIKLGPIRNKDFYIKKIQEDELFDFLLRIEEFNGNQTLEVDELLNEFDDIDIDILDDILTQYNNIRFKINDTHIVTCPCGAKQKYEFDEIPEFFPASWFADGLFSK